ncbi:hypothetical protein FRB91_006515, partial [Serendipita sp. 411]
MAAHSFETLTREKNFLNPPSKGHVNPALDRLAAPHIESFNSIFDDNGLERGDTDGSGLLSLGLKEIGSKAVFSGNTSDPEKPLGARLAIWIEKVTVGRPMVSDKDRHSTERRVFPSEARERLISYRGRMTAKICWTVNEGPENSETRDCGLLPIMVRSVRCNLRGLSSKELIRHHEEPEEFGGYFIINGNERLIRYLILPRRNHVIALIRPSFVNRGPSYTQYAVQIRGTRPDQSSVTNTLHYLSNGSATFRFTWRKSEYVIPIMLILKALVDASDLEIFEAIIMEDYSNTFLTDRIELLLRSFKDHYSLYSGNQCLDYLGEKFRVVLAQPEDVSDRALGVWLLQKVVLVHLESPRDKFRMLVFMLRKLFALVSGQCCADNPDSPQHQEILLPGFLYSMIIKERLEEALNQVRSQIASDIRKEVASVDFFDKRYVNKALQKVNFDIGAKMANFLATGNLVSPTGLDLQQAAGFTIVAEKLNWYRYISHFRCVHRGAFFAELKTTTVRKLLPESWGFICPVHTPDGAPCGLLNHLTHSCRIITQPLKAAHIPSLLYSLGMTHTLAPTVDGTQNLCVQLDGRIIGWATPDLARRMANVLRVYKTEGKNNVPIDLEIGLVPVSRGGQYPGLFLFTTRA